MSLTMKEQVEEIVEIVAKREGVLASDIWGRRRFPHIAEARQISHAVVKEVLGLPYKQIGEIFGMDHTTIMHGVKKATSELGLRLSDYADMAENFEKYRQIATVRSAITHERDALGIAQVEADGYCRNFLAAFSPRKTIQVSFAYRTTGLTLWVAYRSDFDPKSGEWFWEYLGSEPMKDGKNFAPGVTMINRLGTPGRIQGNSGEYLNGAQAK